jgi:hypothetical protein
MYIVAEYGEWRLKRYDGARDEWRMVAGGGVPAEVRRPHVMAVAIRTIDSVCCSYTRPGSPNSWTLSTSTGNTYPIDTALY